MIGPINHVAIAVPDLKGAAARYRDMLGATVSEPLALPEHGVQVVFVGEGETKVELLEPLGPDSPIVSFLSKRPAGGVQQICYEVADIELAAARLEGKGARVLGPPRIGAHGVPVVFVDPKAFDGVLIELQQGR